MTKQDFISTLISEIEGIMLRDLNDCYDVTSSVHKMVDQMTKDYNIEWGDENEKE